MQRMKIAISSLLTEICRPLWRCLMSGLQKKFGVKVDSCLVWNIPSSPGVQWPTVMVMCTLVIGVKNVCTCSQLMMVYIYMGVVVTRKDSIEHLRCLYWCHQTSSLILASCQDIKIVKVDAGIGSIAEQCSE